MVFAGDEWLSTVRNSLWKGRQVMLIIVMTYALLSCIALLYRRNVTWTTRANHIHKQNLPRLVIYRRTPKTASTSMASALLDVLLPLGYEPVKIEKSKEGPTKLFANLHSPAGKPVFLFSHNSFTREVTTRPDVIIMDTIRDGYQHITSYCRYKRNYKTCERSVVDCLENDPRALKQRYYRWAGRRKEDANTFINIPLSSEHPALSTTALRTVFPDVVLHIERYREVNSTCGEVKQVRDVYNRLYLELDKQVNKLRKRLLLLAGYPYTAVQNSSNLLSLAGMLDLAESIERTKYDLRPPRTAGIRSFTIDQISASTGAWAFINGNWVILPSVDMTVYEQRKNESEILQHNLRQP